ncbi:hypothetical protein EXU48_19145 [Occultella glacieicola]|uniref:Uncharacterized protein n=1 Tax=Occultella glacieicola TaxID=2518684 RepID=A0ABY2DZC1_9MICO|nr:hypothetical protein [Occultella glacieicola]TDE90039.1 hypothetical protein EXU48_19145 [Occultella glacieicola]
MTDLEVALENLAADTTKWAEAASGMTTMSTDLAGMTLGELAFTGNDLAAAQAYEEVRAHVAALASSGAEELNATVSTLQTIHADYLANEEAAAAKYRSMWTLDG